MLKCFWLEPTDEMRRSLRRYRWSDDKTPENACPGGYHDAMTPIDTVKVEWRQHGSRQVIANHDDPAAFEGDPRWPVKCARCGIEFRLDDRWQVFTDRLYRRVDTGEIMTLRDAPPGAMWNAWWLGEMSRGQDGRAIVVRCPDGRDWFVDSRASNCTLPDDNVHRCWIRHGEPPALTVDKAGVTCSAGAGSIDTGTWHGFLRNGEFVTC